MAQHQRFPSGIPLDTSPEIYALMVQRWRSMSIAERVELVSQLCEDVERIAIVGIRAQHPTLSDVEIRHQLARRRYGAELADAAYAEALGVARAPHQRDAVFVE